MPEWKAGRFSPPCRLLLPHKLDSVPAKLFYHSGTVAASHQVCRGNPDEKASEQHQDPPERRSADDDGKPQLVKYSEMIGDTIADYPAMSFIFVY